MARNITEKVTRKEMIDPQLEQAGCSRRCLSCDPGGAQAVGRVEAAAPRKHPGQVGSGCSKRFWHNHLVRHKE